MALNPDRISGLEAVAALGDMSNVTPNALAEMLHNATSQTHVNGLIYYPTWATADGGDSINTLTITVKSSRGLAPGATGGPAAQTFDLAIGLLKKDTLFYLLANGGTGTTLDSTRADGRVGASGSKSELQLPEIVMRTNTSGVATVTVTRYTAAGTTGVAGSRGTLSVGDLVFYCRSRSFFGPCNWFTFPSAIDFDA